MNFCTPSVTRKEREVLWLSRLIWKRLMTEWNGLFSLKYYGIRVFLKLGFTWLIKFVSTVSYSILLNGSPFGLFTPQRGLRQGDPISHFLFILCAESLSRLLLHAKNQGSFKGVRISWGAPQISHLNFADDLIIFSKASEEVAANIKECLQEYSTWSGQRINYSKILSHFQPQFGVQFESCNLSRAEFLVIGEWGEIIGTTLAHSKIKEDSFQWR